MAVDTNVVMEPSGRAALEKWLAATDGASALLIPHVCIRSFAIRMVSYFISLAFNALPRTFQIQDTSQSATSVCTIMMAAAVKGLK